LVDDARLVPREPPVLVEDGDERPVLRLAYAPDEAAGAVLALVAVDEYRMIPDVEHLLGGEEEYQMIPDVEHLLGGEEGSRAD